MSPRDSTLLKTKQRLAVANRVLGRWYETLGLGNILMTFGHVSERLNRGNLFLLRGRPRVSDLLIRTKSRDIVTVNLGAVKVGGSADVSMPGETKLHSFLYKNRDDVSAVCHAHPHFSVLASILRLDLKPMCNEGIDLFPVPTLQNNSLISTDDLGTALVQTIAGSNACLLRGHGSVTVADSCEVAVIRMMQLEEQARLNLFAFMARGKEYEGIPDDQAKSYLDAAKAGLRSSGLSEDQIKKHLGGMSLWNFLSKSV